MQGKKHYRIGPKEAIFGEKSRNLNVPRIEPAVNVQTVVLLLEDGLTVQRAIPPIERGMTPEGIKTSKVVEDVCYLHFKI